MGGRLDRVRRPPHDPLGVRRGAGTPIPEGSRGRLTHGDRRRRHHDGRGDPGANGPVAQISHSVGYLDVSNFRRLFQRATGVTPSEYRRRFGIAARVSRQKALSAGQPARIRSAPSR
ncbi:AraC family transcriptional regulator [Actinacidiphila alni]|uniref:AraC family transcriptional regulator n=1 Tax=Actinacidiphila alni TaxID=380248 RepID=UPI000AA6BDB2|nr:AraC family transcriptional regulator [Actinacidiphila alni]